MEEIRKQVVRARRRMVFQQFLGVAAWALFAALLVAAIGLAIPKIWVLPVDSAIWFWSWLGGALGGGLLTAVVWTWWIRQGAMDAAIEIDRRFGLNERVSSTLSLSPRELESPVGQALLTDVVHCVERIDVRDNFQVVVPRRLALPLLPAAVIFVLAFLVENAVPGPGNRAEANTGKEAQQVRNSTDELKKKLQAAEKKAEQKGLKDMDLLLKELQKNLDDVAGKEGVDRKNALVKLNDLAKSVEERRDALAGADKLRQHLDKLKDLDKGPADKMGQAMKDGDLDAAIKELKKLQEALKNGQLTDEQKQQLAKQLDQMKDKLKNTVEAQQQAKQKLAAEIEKRKAAGDLDGAGKLQQQLDQLNKLNDQMERLQKMAESLGQCKECLQKGDCKDAAAQLAKLGDEIQAMKEQLEELQSLKEVMDQIADAKQGMNCEACNGEGCEACMGQGKGPEDGPPGFGLGEGRGQGERPEEKTDTNYYESQVRGKPQAGEAVRTGAASGANRSGRSLEEVKDQIRSSLNQEPDPLTDVRLPKNERQQVLEYYQRMNKK